MKKNKKEVTTKKALRKLIGEAGRLQTAASIAKKGYDKMRGELTDPINDLFGEDKYVRSDDGLYQAILSHDQFTEVNVLDIIKQYNKGNINGGTMRDILSVKVGEAKKKLPKNLQKKLFEELLDNETTLHISKTSPDED